MREAKAGQSFKYDFWRMHNFLKGMQSSKINAIMTEPVFSFRLALRKIKATVFLWLQQNGLLSIEVSIPSNPKKKSLFLLKHENLLIKRWLVPCTIFLFQACKDKPVDPINISDRRKVLTAIGHQVITPGYVDFQNSVNDLIAETALFVNNHTNQSHLIRLKQAWLQCAISWKRVSIFDFGPVDEQFISNGIYGTPDTLEIKKILNNIAQNIDSNYVQNLHPGCKGISAYEYLLFEHSRGDYSKNLELFNEKVYGNRRIDYLLSLAKSLQYYANTALYKWSVGGDNYVSEFIQADEAGKNGSIEVLVNRMEKHISLVKSERIGRPFGKYNGEVPQVNALDGKWSNQSTALLLGEIDAILSVYLGHKMGSINNTGLNFLVNIAGKDKGRPLLSSDIEKQIESVYTKILAIQMPLNQAIISDRKSINELYLELEALDKLVKNDMRNVLGL